MPGWPDAVRMSDSLEPAGTHPPHVVVHPLEVAERPPYRRVDILGTRVGKAYGLVDVIEIMRRAGLEDINLDDRRSIEWQGGGPEVWGP